MYYLPGTFTLRGGSSRLSICQSAARLFLIMNSTLSSGANFLVSRLSDHTLSDLLRTVNYLTSPSTHFRFFRANYLGCTTRATIHSYIASQVCTVPPANGSPPYPDLAHCICFWSVARTFSVRIPPRMTRKALVALAGSATRGQIYKVPV